MPQILHPAKLHFLKIFSGNRTHGTKMSITRNVKISSSDEETKDEELGSQNKEIKNTRNWVACRGLSHLLIP